MRRKVSRIGASTLMVSLPSKWCKANGLKKGDEVDIAEKEATLLISAKGSSPVNEVTIRIDSIDNFARWSISIPYMEGCETIHVVSPDSRVLARAQDIATSHLIGFETVDIGKGYCTLKNVSKGIEEEFPTIFNRMYTLSIAMGESIIEAIESRNYDGLPSLLRMETLSNKLSLFCRRMIRANRISNGYSLYSVSGHLEAINDSLRDIGSFLISNKQVLVRKQTLEFLKQVISILQNSRKFYSFKEKELSALRIKEQVLHQTEQKLYSGSAKDFYICSRLSVVLENLHHLSENAVTFTS